MTELITTTNNQLIKITERFNEQTEQLEQVCSAREVYAFLDLGTKFNDWWNRNVEFLDLDEGRSFLSNPIEIAGNKTNDYILPIDIAKEICIISRSKKGAEFRKYLIQVEKAWNDPDRVMKRAYQILEYRIAMKDKQLEAAKPAISFTNQVANSSDSIDLQEFSSVLNTPGLGRNKLFKLLREKKYLMSDNMPYRQHIEQGLFKVVEQTYSTPYGEKLTTKTLVTGKGQIYITEKIKDWGY